jgi:hypothetical protein
MKKIIPLVLLVGLLTSCDFIKETFNLINCKYKINNASNLTWAGIDLTNIKSASDLSIMDAAKAAAAIASNDYNIGFNLNVLAMNETANPASVKGFDYILSLDEEEFTRGENPNYNVTINPNGGTAIIPIGMKIDAKEFITGGQIQSVINLVQNIANLGNGTETTVGMQFRPWLPIENSVQKMPYIKLSHTFQ